MAYDELASNTKILRVCMERDAEIGQTYVNSAQAYIVYDLQFAARPIPDHPEWEATDAELGARVRMLLAALEAARTPESKPVDPAELETVPDESLEEDYRDEYLDPTYGWSRDPDA